MSPADIALVLAAVAGILLVELFRASRRAKQMEDGWSAALDREEQSAALCRKIQSELAEDVRRLTAERDAALRDKATHFEEAQRQIASLRTAARDMSDRFIAESNAAFRRAERAEKVADAVRALATGKNEPGEWKAVRDALAEFDGEGGTT